MLQYLLFGLEGKVTSELFVKYSMDCLTVVLGDGHRSQLEEVGLDQVGLGLCYHCRSGMVDKIIHGLQYNDSNNRWE